MTYSGRSRDIRAEINSLKARIKELEASLVTINNTSKRKGDITRARWAAWAEAHNAGKSVRQIANMFECDPSSVRHGLKKMGIVGDVKFAPRDPLMKPFVRLHYSQSRSYAATARQFGISAPTVRNWCHE